MAFMDICAHHTRGQIPPQIQVAAKVHGGRGIMPRVRPIKSFSIKWVMV